jgi:hypothetical protein
MSLTEVRKNTQQQTPNTEEESYNEQKDLPVGNSVTPQEAPVPSIRLENRTISVYGWGRENGKRTPLSQ